MSKNYIGLLFFLFSTSAYSNCNLNLARASGLYLQELEKAKLQVYQGDGACKVLDDELKKCTERQRSKLSKEFSLKEVLGNICMPHLPPLTPE